MRAALNKENGEVGECHADGKLWWWQWRYYILSKQGQSLYLHCILVKYQKWMALPKPSGLVTQALVDGQQGTCFLSTIMSITSSNLTDLTGLVEHEFRLI